MGNNEFNPGVSKKTDGTAGFEDYEKTWFQKG